MPSSIDNPNKPLHFIEKHIWTLSAAIELIRDAQMLAHQLGWNLCLAGGVLNNGFSYNDLDIIALPRNLEKEPDYGDLLGLFPNERFNDTQDLQLQNPARLILRRVSRVYPLPIDLIVVLP